MIKRTLLMIPLLLAPLLACAQDQPAVYQEGTHYDLIEPAIRTADPEKIGVTEFFWYGCGHCYTFEPVLGQWKKSLAEDVHFRGSPALWNPDMELHARAYYTAQALGVLDTMHKVLFQAINVDGNRLANKQAIAELFIAHGVEAEAFDKAYESFGVSSQVRQASSRQRAAKITGTPALMVNGKYHISGRKAGSQADMLKIADYLIARERTAPTEGS